MGRRFVLAQALTPGTRFVEFGGWVLVVEVTLGVTKVAVEYLYGAGDEQERSIALFGIDDEVLVEDGEVSDG